MNSDRSGRSADGPFDEAADITQEFWGTTRGWVPRRPDEGDDDTAGTRRARRGGLSGLRARQPARTAQRTGRTRQHGVVRPGDAAPPPQPARDELADGWPLDDWTDDWTSDEVVNHLRGPRGTYVNITVERPNVREPLQFRVERDEIPLITVPYAFEVRPGIAYLKIDRFSESTSEELRKKLDAIGESKLTGLILDLRDNPGGLLNQAIEVSDFFLPRNDLVVSTKGRADGSARSYSAPTGNRIRLPAVVLINRHSASASEIVAGALQDHDRALIVGETSFGKGLVQSVYTLQNDTGMALTTAKYYTPSGRLIQRDYSG